MPLNVSYTGTENEVAKNSTKLKAFLAMTPAEVGTYVDNNVTDLASAKEILIDLAMLVSVAAREIKELKRE